MTPDGGPRFAWDAWACALGVLLLGWSVFSHGDARPDVLRQRAQALADAALAEAGYSWARLHIDNAAGQLQGVAPDARSLDALAEDAPRLLQPYMGVPGVFLHLDNQVQLNQKLPKRPPLPPAEPLGDVLAGLAPTGAGKSQARAPSVAACEKAFQTVQATQPIRFKAGSAQIDESTMPLIQQLAAVAVRCSQWRVVIEGHTDVSGNKALNERLSSRRAAAVAAAMILEGVPLGQLEAVGRGASSPVSAADDKQGAALNRRIEFHVVAANKG